MRDLLHGDALEEVDGIDAEFTARSIHRFDERANNRLASSSAQ